MRSAHSAFAVLALLAVTARVTVAQDLDGDGWTVADGDCADVPSGAITSPELVNPGAYDIPGNGIDDDCDGAVDNPNTGSCSPAAVFSANAIQLASALDLCQTTTLNAPLPFRRWGLILAVLQRASGATAPAAAQSSVLAQFGTLVFPEAHATMAAISSGVARDADDTGFVPVSPGFDSGLGTVNAPSDFATPNGGLYHRNGCVQPHLPVYDSVKLRLQIRVPTNASGFTFRHRFFSAEYPDQCSTYNDHLLALLTSAHPGVPPNKNILFDSNSNPMTVQTAFFECCLNCPQNDADLQGTGYSTLGDAATAWNTAIAPVLPGEVITLEFHIWDSSDASDDALALLDDFEWLTMPQTVDVADERGADALDLIASPNPFRGSTTLAFALPAPGEATLEIFDVLGRRVRTLARGAHPAGVTRVAWDGTTAAGAPVRTGAYFAKVSSRGREVVTRVVRER